MDTDRYKSIAAADLTGPEPSALQRHILTSLVLRYDQAVNTTLSEYAQGSLASGIHRFDLANEGMEIAYSGGFIDDIRDTLEGLKRKIIAGEIRVSWIPGEKKEEVGGSSWPHPAALVPLISWEIHLGYAPVCAVFRICPASHAPPLRRVCAGPPEPFPGHLPSLSA